MVSVGLLKEGGAETRVSLLPAEVRALCGMGYRVLVESGAGEKSFASDSDYEQARAIVTSREEVFGQCQILLSIHFPHEEELAKANPGTLFIGLYEVLWYPERAQRGAEKGLSLMSLDRLPRTTRAQLMDVLSSMAVIAGYKAVLLAAEALPRFFPMLSTAAGTIKPAQVVVVGAGVAGLQAIATARRLGARVEAFDVRPETKEQVESLGAQFIEVEGAVVDPSTGGYATEQPEAYRQRQQEKLKERIGKADVIITTAMVPGKRAPLIIPKELVELMPPGSVIVDLAARAGGNCELTQPDQRVQYKGKTIFGYTNLPALLPHHASQMYGRNLLNLFQILFEDEQKTKWNLKDELISAMMTVLNGEIRDQAVSEKRTFTK
jgi:NAD(P) transhydrogenase subunit alpha